MSRALVFTTRQAPWPADVGARIRTHRLLTGLAETFDTTLVTFEHEEGSSHGVVSRTELARALSGIEVVTVPGLGAGKRLGQARTLLSSRSWAWGRYHVPALGRALVDAVARRRPALVHFDDPGTGAFAPVASAVNVFAPHNVEHRIERGTAEVSRGIRRAFAELEWRKVAREEARLWRQADLCVAVSEVDAAAMHAGGAHRVEVCPNGADPVERLPGPRRRRDEPLRLLFVGAGSYQPYRYGVTWLVRDVLPRVLAQLPVVLDVVGADPPRAAAPPGVVYHGRVTSVEPFYARAHAAVVPVFQGSGTRLKVIEAMAYGRPVVSTPLGTEGLPVSPGEHYLEAATADAFAAELAVLARLCESGDEALEGLLLRARDAVEPLLWPRIVRSLTELYAAAAALEPSPGGRAPGADRRPAPELRR